MNKLSTEQLEAIAAEATNPNANGLIERFMVGIRGVYILRSDATFFESPEAPDACVTELEARQKLAERLIAEKKEIIAAIAENAERIELLQGGWESIA